MVVIFSGILAWVIKYQAHSQHISSANSTVAGNSWLTLLDMEEFANTVTTVACSDQMFCEFCMYRQFCSMKS